MQKRLHALAHADKVYFALAQILKGILNITKDKIIWFFNVYKNIKVAFRALFITRYRAKDADRAYAIFGGKLRFELTKQFDVMLTIVHRYHE